MLDKLIHIALQRRLIVVVLACALLAVGAYISLKLPIDVFPDLTAPTVTIMTEAHGMATEEVEVLVSLPIESAVNGATNVRRVRSSSAPGFSVVWVEFDWGTDILVARQIVNEKIQVAISDLPKEVDKPVLAPISSIMGEIMLVGLTLDKKNNPNNLTMMDVRTLADFDIRRRLLAINGVSQVVPIGGDVKQYQIYISPSKLMAYDISINEVLEAAEETNVNSSGGSYMNAGNEYWIRGLGRVEKIKDIKKSVVAVRDNIPILFEDIAEVKIGPAVKFGDATLNTESAVLLTIQKQPDANTLDLTEEISRILNDMQKTFPEGVKLNTNIFRQADFITTAIQNVVGALRDGAILVLIVIFFFLWNIRTTFISVVAIPISLVITVMIFQFFDIMINTMTLGGMAIAIGALVDDAIIDVENVFRRLKENKIKPESERENSIAVIYNASKEIRAPMVNATFIIIVVFIPLFFLSGVEGRLLRPMGYAYVTSIFASLLVALTVTPVMSYYLLSNAKFMTKEGDSWLVEKLKIIYEKILKEAIKHPRIIILSSILILLVTLSVIPFLGRSFLPEFNEGAFTLSVVTLPGTSIQESNKIGTLVETVLLEHPEVISTARRTGRAELDEHAQGVNGAEIDVKFLLEDKTKEEFIQELRSSFKSIPGTNITIGQPLSHRIDHMLSGTRANIAVKIFGENLHMLRSIAKSVQSEMKKVEGAVDVSVDQEVEVPQTKIKFNRAKMAKYGVTVAELAEAVDIAFSGETVSEVLEGQNNFELIVRFDENSRGNINKIKDALFDTKIGAKVLLSEMADVVNEKGPNRISRENVQRKIVVQANVSGRDLRSVVDDMNKNINDNVDLPQGYFVEFGGQFESEQQATKIITLLSLVSIGIIFLILYMQFNEIKPALFILVNLPLALIGGVWAVYFSDGIISVASLVGFISLFGIATRNGILMISHFKNLISEGLDFKEVIIKGSLERLNPILMTAITAGLALIPLAIGAGEPGKEIEAPMAIVILGGLFTSTTLNMIVVPSLFYKFGNNK